MALPSLGNMIEEDERISKNIASGVMRLVETSDVMERTLMDILDVMNRQYDLFAQRHQDDFDDQSRDSVREKIEKQVEREKEIEASRFRNTRIESSKSESKFGILSLLDSVGKRFMTSSRALGIAGMLSAVTFLSEDGRMEAISAKFEEMKPDIMNFLEALKEFAFDIFPMSLR